MKVKVGDIFLIVGDLQGNKGKLVKVWNLSLDWLEPRIIGVEYGDYNHYGVYCRKTLQDVTQPEDQLAPLCPAIRILFGVSDGN